MILRKERHREILLAAIKACNFPGDVVEEIVELKAEVMLATVQVPDAPPNGNGAPPPEGTGYRPDEALSHRNAP